MKEKLLDLCLQYGHNPCHPNQFIGSSLVPAQSHPMLELKGLRSPSNFYYTKIFIYKNIVFLFDTTFTLCHLAAAQGGRVVVAPLVPPTMSFPAKIDSSK